MTCVSSQEHLRNVILGDQYRWDIPVPYVLDPSLGKASEMVLCVG